MRAWLCISLLVLAGCGGTKVRPVHIAMNTSIAETFLVPLARELGYFREEGLEVVVDNLVAGRIIESVIAGSSDVAYTGYNAMLQVAATGRSLRSFFVGSDGLTSMLVVSEAKAGKIGRPEDLAGATIGIPSFGSGSHQFLAWFLGQHGLSVANVKLVPYGSGPAAVAALQYGKVDAGMMNASAFAVLTRRSPGVRILADPRTRQRTKELTGIDPYPNFALFSTSEWSENPAAAQKLTSAMVRALRWVHSHTAEELLSRVPASFRTDDKEADLETMRYLIESTSKDGRMPPDAPEGVRRIVAVTNEKVRNAKIDLAATYTNQFVDEVSK